MQILLHSDLNTDGSQPMAEHFTTVVNGALGRFGKRITRVEAHLSDVDGQGKSSAGEIHCTLDARLVGLDAVVVKAHAGSAHEAIDGAVRRLKRAVGAEIGKHDPRRQRATSRMPAAEPALDALDPDAG
jgi:ribosome-associated translation inhibitor RaiA